MIKVIGFDLDNTLWPVKPAILYAEQQLKNHLTALKPGIAYPPEDIQALRDTVLAEHPDYSFRLTDLRRAILHRLVQREPRHHEQTQDIVDRAMQIFLKARNHVTLYSGAEAALSALSQTYALCTLTNGNADVSQTPLAAFFSFALKAEDVGAAKPAPDLFLAAMAQANSSPEHIVHVGDSHDHDIVGAHGVGIRSVWLTSEQQPSTLASSTIQCLSELPNIIRSLQSEN